MECSSICACATAVHCAVEPPHQPLLLGLVSLCAAFLKPCCCSMLCVVQSLHVGWLLATGGPKVLGMTLSTLSGAMGSVVQGGLDCGDIEYHVIVAKKP